MIRGIYTTATGMIADQRRLDVIANNLANVTTTGYKRDAIAFGEAYEREMRTNGGLGASLGTIGSGPAERGRYTIFEQGPTNPTGNVLDVAINQATGAFGVQLENGKTAYTRDGCFRLDSDMQLVTQAGHPVLDDAEQPITLPQGQINIAEDGTISVNGTKVAKLGLFDGPFRKALPNLMVVADADQSKVQAIDLPNLTPGALEGSNVNAVEAMVQMININRSFELAQKSVQQEDDLTKRLIQSLQG